MKPHSFHREAREEYAEAAKHYVGVSPVLGQRFYQVIDALIADACTLPQTFRMIHPPVRRHFTREFPYGIFYVDRPDDIWILAVMPLHRKPGYWLHRLP